jgi:hypothetical protein
MLGLSMNISQQRAKAARMALAGQVGKLKSSMVAAHFERVQEEQKQESKLVKFITLLQDNFASDKVHEQAMEDFQLSLGTELKTHKRMLKKELKTLGGNEKVKGYLAKALDKAADDFYYKATEQVQSMGMAIVKEGAEAEFRLRDLTESMTKELKAETVEEVREEQEEEKVESADPGWKRMAAHFNKKHTQTESQDQKDEEHMLDQVRVTTTPPPSLLYLPITITISHHYFPSLSCLFVVPAKPVATGVFSSEAQPIVAS